MRYSELFGKTNKNSKEFESKNATLLIKGGFIDQVMAGVYCFLPLGLRVLNKIENIIREEMNTVGQEVLLTTLGPKKNWETTGRIDTVDVLMKVIAANEISKKRNDSEYILNCTHEDLITPLAKKFHFTYRDFPFGLYQIQNKFRNEERPKSGLLRGREFRMKDLYSFHKNEEELKEYYLKVKEVYHRIFDRLGLGEDTYYVAASGGDFTQEYSHEFQTLCVSGEDEIFLVPSTKEAFNKEIAPSMAPEVQQDAEMMEMQEVFGENIIGVDDLCRFLEIQPHQTTKTLVYMTNMNEVILACVRGDYDVNELKLAKAAGVSSVTLADEKTVKKVTGAEIGYAGIVNVPKDIRVFIDDSMKPLINFETGANKTNYHVKNVNWDRDVQKPESFFDIKEVKEGDLHPETGEVYEMHIASEVGNIFPLNTKFSEAFDYTYTDEKGKQQIVYMGSYGIGTTRVMGVLAEKFHDDKGLMWPQQVAPFHVHLITLDTDFNDEAEQIKTELEEKGIEVLWDDRDDVSAGVKFADADLIGIPYRLVISKKSKEAGGFELKGRNESESQIVSSINEVLEKIS